MSTTCAVWIKASISSAADPPWADSQPAGGSPCALPMSWRLAPHRDRRKVCPGSIYKILCARAVRPPGQVDQTRSSGLGRDLDKARTERLGDGDRRRKSRKGSATIG